MKPKGCKPRIVPRVTSIPSRKVKCGNCSCRVYIGQCHCGATNAWAYDYYDGWYQTCTIPHIIVKDA